MEVQEASPVANDKGVLGIGRCGRCRLEYRGCREHPH